MHDKSTTHRRIRLFPQSPNSKSSFDNFDGLAIPQFRNLRPRLAPRTFPDADPRIFRQRIRIQRTKIHVFWAVWPSIGVRLIKYADLEQGEMVEES
jgi:hypothetical protein